jgi:hypothetical protein
MTLCANRADGGQGTFKGDLTTCTEDSFIVPLPAIVLCIGFLICFAVRRHYPGEKYDDHERVGMQPMNSGFLGKVKAKLGGEKREVGITSVKGSRSGMNIGLSSLLVLLMTALFGLHVLEMCKSLLNRHERQLISRLAKLDAALLGYGLLPLVCVGLVIAIITMIIPTYATNALRRRARPHYFPWAIFMAIFFGGMAVVLGVKIHTLFRTGTLLGDKVDKTAAKAPPFSYALRKVSQVTGISLRLLIPLYTAGEHRHVRNVQLQFLPLHLRQRTRPKGSQTSLEVDTNP